ncbi:myb-like protein AA [Drosophila innubila]|uniref:myb-like protein AA n=1 Tax=Drosophila innubila TaxID=198719 RepID=UPI00148C670F|nr:myb-like protein AA [Drosophila innubila]
MLDDNNGTTTTTDGLLVLATSACHFGPFCPPAANCSVGNTTFAHGATFKLDCKTQCVCENGRHACSTLCPNEQLPAPEDTISCRSPRLVEVPGHCCKMWLCENPTADVYATCHNSSISGKWSSCSSSCGLGMATRQTTTHTGCHQLSNLRLCENRRCGQDNKKSNTKSRSHNRPLTKHNLASSQLHQLHHHKRERQRQREWEWQREPKPNPIQEQEREHQMQQEPAHRIRKGHECRSLQRLGPARIRLGQCVSRKLYRPKLCGSCHRGSKCCAPAVSTTIQVELLCPLNAVDPINYVQKRTQQHSKQQDDEDDSTEGGGGQQQQGQLWDTIALEPIDQEFLQSHQTQIENKFIAVEWILKCECSKNYCNSDSGNNHNNRNNNKHNLQHAQQQQKTHYIEKELRLTHDAVDYRLEVENGQRTMNSEEHGDVQDVRNEDIVNAINNSNDDNSSSEQQPDIIPYPLSVGETSWKAEKLQRQRKQKQQQQQQQERWKRT